MDLYGVSTPSAVVDLPSHIDRLIKTLPVHSKYTSEGFIYGHTLYPFYAPFLPPDRSRLVFERMKGDLGGTLHCMTGIMASAFPVPRYLRFCPECNKSDYHAYGELYWHRVHQIPGVLVCPEHKVMLKSSTVLYRGLNKHEYVSADFENCPSESSNSLLPVEVLDRLFKISMDCKWLLENKLESRNLNWFKDNYIAYLASKDLVSPKGFVDKEILTGQFIAFFGAELLRLLHSEFDSGTESTWIKSIVRKHRKTFHPIRHLLMIRFLTGSMESFFGNDLTYRPFGETPWPCLNSTSPHYLESVIENIEITTCSKTSKPVGTFQCSCGFVYSRRGPDETEKDRLRVGRTKSFGSIWEAELKSCLQEKDLGLRAIARKMKCDTKTVIKYADKLGLNLIWRTKECRQPKNRPINHSKAINEYRSKWEDFISSYPYLQVTSLRKIRPGLYMWLYRHDREWLKGISPHREKIHCENRRVDWMARDMSLLGQVKLALESILRSEEKPVRITVGRVGKIVGVNALFEKHLEKLPETKDYLLSIIETRESFQCRRVRWAAKCLSEKGEEVKAWKIIRLAGIRPGTSKEVDEEIERLVSLYCPVNSCMKVGEIKWLP